MIPVAGRRLRLRLMPLGAVLRGVAQRLPRQKPLRLTHPSRRCLRLLAPTSFRAMCYSTLLNPPATPHPLVIRHLPVIRHPLVIRRLLVTPHLEDRRRSPRGARLTMIAISGRSQSLEEPLESSFRTNATLANE